MPAIRGSISLHDVRSPSHSRFVLTEGAAVHLYVQCYALRPLETGEEANLIVGMSMECFLAQRIKPIQTCTRSVVPSVDTDGRLGAQTSFEFTDVPIGQYHIIAFTLGSFDAPPRYHHPQLQSFGFYANHANGDKWPWSVIEVNGGADIVLGSFIMRVPHSFECFKKGKTLSSVAHRASHAHLSLLKDCMIPVLAFTPATASQRGHDHGLLLAPYIIDWWQFYLFEHRFAGNVAAYNNFIDRWVDPKNQFFSYPQDAMDEAHGIIEGMKATGMSMYLDVIGRDYDFRDALSGFIETRTVQSERSAYAIAHPIPTSTSSPSSVIPASAAAAPSSSNDASSTPAPLQTHHCSQTVVWGQQTGGVVIAGRNMDGEIDIRKVTATHTVLFATDRDPPTNGANAPPSFRTISCMWPGTSGTLTGINETGFYLCENAGATQPDSGIVSGLTPVACVQQAALRQLDGRTLTVQRMKQFLEPYISRTGWNHASHKPTSADDRTKDVKAIAAPQYASATNGGFSGPGSLFVCALPPCGSPSAADASSSSSSSLPPSTSDPRAFVVECDRTHTSFRVPGVAPPFEPDDSIIATNHFLELGFDDVGVVSRDREHQRAPHIASKKCVSMNPTYSGAAASNKFTNWNVPLSTSSHWRFESGRNRLQAWSRQKKKLDATHLQELLQVMCPAYTEHAFACEMYPDGRVRVHVSVADSEAGLWDAPYMKWHSFDFNELFTQPHGM